MKILCRKKVTQKTFDLQKSKIFAAEQEILFFPQIFEKNLQIESFLPSFFTKNGAAICEGPYFIQKDGRVYLAYCANGCWSDDYALGILEYKGVTFAPPSGE